MLQLVVVAILLAILLYWLVGMVLLLVPPAPRGLPRPQIRRQLALPAPPRLIRSRPTQDGLVGTVEKMALEAPPLAAPSQTPSTKKTSSTPCSTPSSKKSKEEAMGEAEVETGVQTQTETETQTQTKAKDSTDSVEPRQSAKVYY